MGKSRKNSASKEVKSRPAVWTWLVVFAAVVFVAAIRIRLLQVPLERDEGEFAYMAQLMLQGHPPYSLAYNMKLPGVYAAYALIMAVFGQTIGGVHLGFLFFNASAIVMVFLLGRRLFGPSFGAAAAVAYAILTVQPGVFGTSAHATHFVVIFALPGILLLLRALESRKLPELIGSGLLLGTAFLMKQPGVLFVVFGIVHLVWSDRKVNPLSLPQSLRRLGLFLLSAALPYGITCLWLWKAGVFSRFWFWTFDYARVYGSATSFSESLGELSVQLRVVILPMVILWICALAGLTVFAWDKEARKRLWFVVSFLIFSAAAVCAGSRFSGHYFVLVFPALALLAGLSVSAYAKMLSCKRSGHLLRLIPVAVFLLSVCLPVYQQRDLFFSMSNEEASRAMYGWNPFPEAVEIGKVLREHSRPEDRIAVLGSEPEILFYARRRSATGYIYMYALTEMQPYAARMRKEMIDEVTRARPEYLVIMAPSCSWVSTRRQNNEVMEWVQQYAKSGYRPIARVWEDPSNPDARIYSWDNPAGEGKPVVDILQKVE